MAFCVECGTKIENNEMICSYCGKEMKAEQNAKQELFTEKINSINNTPDSTQDFDAEDIRDNKRMALLSYLSWLVIIPLISSPKSKYARYHMNQGLVLAILEIIWMILTMILNSIFFAISWRLGSIVSTIFSVCSFTFLILSIMGIINVVNGKAKELPFIGKIKLIK